MNAVWAFLIGVALTACFALLVVKYLRSSLKKILVDLCGSSERAEFWLAFTNVTLILVPVSVALHIRPGASSLAGFIFDLSDQLEATIWGLILTLVILGIVLTRHISSNALSHQVGSHPAAKP